MLKKFLWPSLIFVFIGSCIAGCSAVIGHQIEASDYSQVKKGVSTKDDVIELLGSPNNEEDYEDGSSMFIYTFVKVSNGIYGIGAGSESQTTRIKFNKAGIVVSKSKSSSDTGGSGISGAIK